MFLKTVVSALAMASSVLAIAFNSVPTAIVAGQTYDLTWSTTGSGPVTILLRQGPSTNLQTVGTITTTGSGGSYSWTAPSTYPPGNDYAFQITDDSGTNYSGLIPYTGGTAPSSSASASVSASASYSASASISCSTSTVYYTTKSYPISAPNGYKNSTSTLQTSTATAIATTAPSPTTAVQLPGSGASSLSSPVALILGAVAAMLYLQ